MEQKDEIIQSNTEKKIFQLQEKIELLQAKLTASTAQLSSSESTIKELTNYKLRTEQMSAFKSMGGKEDYFSAYTKLNDELGEKPTQAKIDSFKQKYSNMFEESTATPTNAVSGQTDQITSNEPAKARIVDDGVDGDTFSVAE